MNTDDYVFKGLEAVSQNDRSVSRADCVEFKQLSKDVKKGIFKYKVKLISNNKDVLIRPVCVAVPKITSITPAFESNGCDQDTIIKINFNKAINPDTFDPSNISIYSEDNLSEYFEEASFSSDNKTLLITPKKDKLILPPDEAKSVTNIEVNYDFTSLKDSDGFNLSAQGTHNYKINKNFGNQKKVKVLIQTDSAYGSFLSAGEKECVVGYTTELQFTLKKSEYKFLRFEAISSTDNSISRADCISLENEDYNDETGIYKAKVRILSEQNDILIRPVCVSIPKLVEILPKLESNGCDQDTPIKITFNKAVDPATFKAEFISIYAEDDLSDYFDEAKFTSDNKTLYISPKTNKLILAPDGTKAMQTVKVDYNFGGMKDADGLDVSINGTYAYKINKNFSNQHKVNVLVRSDSNYGSFLSDGEKECIVGYTIDVQFNINKEDYKFYDFEAVSSANNSLSRADCISIENKNYNDETGIYKAKIRVVKELNDILIRPKCQFLPYVKEKNPSSPEIANFTTVPIVITFNMAMDESITSKVIMISRGADVSEYFETPVLNASKDVLTIKTKKQELKSFIEGLKVPYIDISVSFTDDAAVKVGEVNLPLKKTGSSFPVRYKPEYEKTAPTETDFFASRYQMSLDTIGTVSSDSEKKLLIENIDLSNAVLPEDKIIHNRIYESFYIYGKYYDKDTGVKKVEVTTRYIYDICGVEPPASELNDCTTCYTAESENAVFRDDGNGSTEFCIKHGFYADYGHLSGVYLITIAVYDDCGNQAEKKIFTVFNRLLDSGVYLTNEPVNYTGKTIDEYKESLKEIRINYNNPEGTSIPPFENYVFQDIRIPREDFKIFCEYKNINTTGVKEEVKYDPEKNIWKLPLNVASVADLELKVLIYDKDILIDETLYNFPPLYDFRTTWINERSDSDNVGMSAVKGFRIVGVKTDNENIVEGMFNTFQGAFDFYYDKKNYVETIIYPLLYGELVSYDDIKNAYEIPLPSVVVKGYSVDDTDWKKTGDVKVTVDLADDTWDDDKYDSVYYYFDGDDYYLTKGQCSIEFRTSILLQYDLDLVFVGVKNSKESEGRSYRIRKDPDKGYDRTPPEITFEHDEYDNYTLTITDSGSGPDYGIFTIGDEEIRLDEETGFTYKIPATKIYELSTRANGSWSTLYREFKIPYEICDKAGNKTASTKYERWDTEPEALNANSIYYNDSGIGMYLSSKYGDYRFRDMTINVYGLNDGNWNALDENLHMTVSTSKKNGYISSYNYDARCNNIPNDTFVKIVSYTPSYYYPAPLYIYRGQKRNSKKYDFILPNGGSKTSVLISSDAPVLVHTCIGTSNYEECKDWNISEWQEFRDEVGLKVMDLTPESHTITIGEGESAQTGTYTDSSKIQAYEIPVKNIPEGRCYCVIAHFANGTSAMSAVMQK